MKKLLIILGIALLCLPVLAIADEDKPIDTAAVKGDVKADVEADVDTAAPEKEVTLAEYLIGEWDLAPSKYRVSGDLTFRADGTYERMEMDPKGVGGGVKGQYILYPDQKPCGIDLCAGKCGRTGSEWTTMFGIVRKLDDGRVEILTSPSKNRPTKFGEEPDERYTMFLTRKAGKEKE